MSSNSTHTKLFTETDLTLEGAIVIATAVKMAVLEHQQETTVSAQSEIYNVRYKNVCFMRGNNIHMPLLTNDLL